MIDAADHFTLSPGTVVEEYRIMSVLGQGSFGVTYLAEDVNLGTRLAIKEYLPGDWAFRDSTQTVRPKSTAVSESFERGQDSFLKEARLLAQVAHPNVVKVRRFFRSFGTAYIAMDFIEGRSLGDTLNEDYRAGGYPSLALKQLLVALLGGLAAIHQRRIIHRDIKPGNVVIEPGGTPMLVDFGAARIFDRAVAQGMTVIVTPGYAPIEQYSDDGEQGPFTDIYALGALAYRAMTGRPPDAPYKRLGSNSTLPATLAGAGKYPAALLEAIDWALAVQPQDRPQSAEALLEKLRAAPDEVPPPLDEPTQILEATQILETSRWRDASKGTSGTVRVEPSLKTAQAEGIAPSRPPPVEASAVADAAIAAAPQKRNRLIPALAAALLFIAAGAGTYYLMPGLHSGSSTPDQGATAQQKADAEAAEAARAEAARQAAAKAEADRQAAAQAEADRQAAAKAEADRQAAAKAEAERQAAAKAEANRQAAAKAEAERQAAAKAEADRQAAAKAEAERQAAAKAEADRQAAAAKAEAERQAAAKAETDRQAAAKAEADRQAAAAKAEADRQAAAKAEAEKQAAAKAEADRRAAAKAEAAARAATQAEEKRAAAAAAAAAKKPKPRPIDTASTLPSDAARCSSILQNAQLKEQISDDDRSFLRDHCH